MIINNFHSLCANNQLFEIKKVLLNTKEDTGILGKHTFIVTIDEREERIPFEEIKRQALKACNRRLKAKDLTYEEENATEEITNSIARLHSTIDHDIPKKNSIISVLSRIKKIKASSYISRSNTKVRTLERDFICSQSNAILQQSENFDYSINVITRSPHITPPISSCKKRLEKSVSMGNLESYSTKHKLNLSVSGNPLPSFLYNNTLN